MTKQKIKEEEERKILEEQVSIKLQVFIIIYLYFNLMFCFDLNNFLFKNDFQAWWRGTMVRRGLGAFRKDEKKGKKGKKGGKKGGKGKGKKKK